MCLPGIARITPHTSHAECSKQGGGKVGIILGQKFKCLFSIVYRNIFPKQIFKNYDFRRMARQAGYVLA